MAKTRAKASADAKKIVAGFENAYDDNPNVKYKWGWPAICALGRKHPELAYNRVSGFVYDTRSKTRDDPIVARIKEKNSLSYNIIVDKQIVATKQTIGQCLEWIKLHILGII